jgi:hypothetical protein
VPDIRYEAMLLWKVLGVVPALKQIRKIFIMAKTFSFDLMMSNSDSFSYDEEDIRMFEEEYMEKPNTSIEGKIILWNDLDNEDKADWIVRHQNLRVDSCDDATYVDNVEWSE